MSQEAPRLHKCGLGMFPFIRIVLNRDDNNRGYSTWRFMVLGNEL